MKICLAALENCSEVIKDIPDGYLKYGLTSFYYLKNDEHLSAILKKVRYVLVDSGAHSFQHGVKVDFEKYTDEYIEFIKRWTDNPQIIGFFEMDVDNVIGSEKVLELRKRLETVSNKIIPVWHNGRGINNFIEMCKEYTGRRVAITGFRNGDIYDEQYNLFINTAHSYGCKIHILGLTRFDLIRNLNLGLKDSTDSNSWNQAGIFGNGFLIDKKNTLYNISTFEGLKIHHTILRSYNFYIYKKLQDIYDNIDNSVVSSRNPHI